MKKFWSKRKSVLAQTVFPYVGKDFPENKWTPFRAKDLNYPHTTLPGIFQPLWDCICVNHPGVFKNRIDEAMFHIAEQNIQSNKNKIVLCLGSIKMDKLRILYELEVIPGTEPYINLIFILGNIKVYMNTHYWSIISGRPHDWVNRPMWFSLTVEKFEYVKGEFETVESICLNHTDFSYVGQTFFGKRVEKECSFCQVYNYKFRMEITGTEIKFTGPFIQKLNEHLKPFGLFLETP